MRCKTCHYSLEGLTGLPHRCPECGTPFDPNDPRTFDDPASNSDAERDEVVMSIWALGILCSLALPLIGLLIAGGGHGWTKGFEAGLAAPVLVPLTIVCWHQRRRPTVLVLVSLTLVLAVDSWVVWHALWSYHAGYLQASYRGIPSLTVLWFVAWFIWQPLLLPALSRLLFRFFGFECRGADSSAPLR